MDGVFCKNKIHHCSNKWSPILLEWLSGYDARFKTYLLNNGLMENLCKHPTSCFVSSGHCRQITWWQLLGKAQKKQCGRNSNHTFRIFYMVFHPCFPQSGQVLHRFHLGGLQKQHLEASVPTDVKGGNVWGNTYFDWKMLNHVNYPRKNHTPFDSRWVTTKTSQNWPGAVPDRPHHLGLQKQDFKACIETRVKVWRLERAT